MSETSQQPTDGGRTADEHDADSTGAFVSRPTLKPVGLALGLTVFVTAAVAAVLFANPTLLGTAELTQVALWGVLLIGGFISLRLLVKMYILSRMTYRISGDGVVREYALLYRYRRREMPLRKVRGVEISRDPIETALGFGTVAILSGGTNQSLGFIEFEHVPNPEAVRDAILRYSK